MAGRAKEAGKIRIIAIDPGTEESAFVVLDEGYSIHKAGKIGNAEMMQIIQTEPDIGVIVIEDIEPRYSSGDRSAAGAVMGQSTIETIKAMGRFALLAEQRGARLEWIYRREERSALIPTKKNGLPPLPPDAPKHADGQIRASLIRRFARHDVINGRGTKADPDTFHGFHGDMWQAMAVGVTWLDKERGRKHAGRPGGRESADRLRLRGV